MFHNCAPSYQWGHKSTLPENTSTQNKGDWTANKSTIRSRSNFKIRFVKL